MTQSVSKDSPLILASSSRYRAYLLARLRLPFEVKASGIDEKPQPRETPAALVERLAKAKAEHVAARHPDRWVLGSDQVAECDGRLLGKPGTKERAIEQLGLLSGRLVVFHTAVALVHHSSQRHFATGYVTLVQFRRLKADEIARYVEAEHVLDSAGSFLSEGLGISLCERVESQDPTALIGLPLIGVRQLLTQAGVTIP